MADGFLGRWSRRKLEVKEGKAVEAEAPRAEAPPPQPSPGGEGRQGEGPTAIEHAAPQEPPPTLDDTHDLTPASDFSRFVRTGVPADVKNAALKKLFADPRFNVQDGLDVYIDDYGQPDPLPESMLARLSGARFLGLGRDETHEGPRDDAEGQAAPSVAQSAPSVPADPLPVPPAVPFDHAHPDLRLQQDDAAGCGEPRQDAG